MKIAGLSRLPQNVDIEMSSLRNTIVKGIVVCLASVACSVMAQPLAGMEKSNLPILLATNLKGDEVLWVGETSENGQRFVTSLLRYRTFSPVLNIDDAVSRADLQVFDCLAKTRTLAGVRVFRLVEGKGQLAKEVEIPVSDRQAQPVFGPNSESLIPAVFRAACGAKDLLAKNKNDPWANGQTQPQGNTRGAVPDTTGSVLPAGPAQPSVPGSAAGPAEPFEPEGGLDPVQAPLPVDPPPRSGDADKPVFSDYVFTLRTLAQLSDFVYLTEPDVVKSKATIDVLKTAESLFGSRAGQQGNYREAVTRSALAQAEQELAHDEQRLSEKRSLLQRTRLDEVQLPILRQAISSFRAELYRQTPSGQYVLVFRGSAEVYDWISNLWVGVDLAQMEAPHYAAAKELVGLLVKKGIRPLVTGHSLGGGMAQYVAHIYGLKVAAFNASPLPARYLPKKAKFDADNARIFAALELPVRSSAEGQPDRRLGDPVSLGVANVAKWAAKFTEALKASHHLVPPICLLTRPEPHRTELEDKKMANILSAMFVMRPVFDVLIGRNIVLAAKGGAAFGISEAVKALLDDPVWSPPHSPLKEAGQRARNRVVHVVLAQMVAAKGAYQMGKWIFQKNMGKTALELAGAMAEAAAGAWVNRLLEVHSMERFVRGLEAYGDTSPYKLTQDTSGPCREVLSVY